jgi:hypothetical protein
MHRHEPAADTAKKDIKFEWTEAQQLSYDKLKATLTSDLGLAHPRFDLPCMLSCDACSYAISAVLSQLQNSTEWPVSFACRMLNKAEKNYSTTHKELLAVIFGLQVHRCCLNGQKFKIVTEHAVLKWLITVQNHKFVLLARWV